MSYVEPVQKYKSVFITDQKKNLEGYGRIEDILGAT